MSLDTKRFATQKNTKTEHEPVPQWPDYDVPRKLDVKDYVAPVFHEKTLNFFFMTCQFQSAGLPILNRAEVEDLESDNASERFDLPGKPER